MKSLFSCSLTGNRAVLRAKKKPWKNPQPLKLKKDCGNEDAVVLSDDFLTPNGL